MNLEILKLHHARVREDLDTKNLVPFYATCEVHLAVKNV